MTNFNLPFPEKYFINKAKITAIVEDRIGTENRDSIFDPNKKGGLVMKISIAADDENGQRYGSIIKANENLDGFENLSRIPSVDEICYIIHLKHPFYVDSRETIAYDTVAIFDLDGNLIYDNPHETFLYDLQQLIPTKLKLNINSIKSK